MNTTEVLILGSGGAALVAALAAAESGARVTVLEASDRLGGTTAVSGGMLWIPCNGLSEEIGVTDTREEAITYLARVAHGSVDDAHLEALVDTGPELVSFLHRRTPVRLFPIDRPDYNAHWDGGKHGGRVLDNHPFEAGASPDIAALSRNGAHFPRLTYAERRIWRSPELYDQDLLAERERKDIRTLGAALVAALLTAASQGGVRLEPETRALGLSRASDGTFDVICSGKQGPSTWRAEHAVIVATGGFEWDPDLTEGFLRGPVSAIASPPWNVGDGLRMLMSAGASLAQMAHGWWAPMYQVPGEAYEGRPMARHLVDELSLPGTILVNDAGRRFVNESVNYNDLVSTLHHFDPSAYKYRNLPAWLIFDDQVKQQFAVATVPPGTPAPEWFHPSQTLDDLADRIGVDRAGLTDTVSRFNRDAAEGVDRDFGRGRHALDLYYGHPDNRPNPSLRAVEHGPYYAIQVHPGLLGTKGGARTDIDGRVLGHDGQPIAGLYACGNAAASPIGIGYPGAGGSLGPLLTFGYRAGLAAVGDSVRSE